MAVIPIFKGYQCKECHSNEISISEGDNNVEEDIQRAINDGSQIYRISYMCLICGHEGYIALTQEIES